MTRWLTAPVIPSLDTVPDEPIVGQIYYDPDADSVYIYNEPSGWTPIGATPLLPSLSTPPSSPVEGQQYYDTDVDSVYVYTSTGWVPVGNGAGAGLPVGGTTDQVLVKASGSDFHVMWSTLLRAIVLSTKTASYTLTSGDEEDLVLVDNVSATVVTVPANATTAFPLGTRIRIAQIGAGDVSIAGAIGVTLLYPNTSVPTIIAQGGTIELIKIGTNSWILDGHGNLSTTELGWQAFTPTINATTSGPSLGSGSMQKGLYCRDNMDRIIGAATVRWGTGGGRGNGVYKLSLPDPGVNVDDEHATPIGSASVGVGFTHTPGLLHYNSVTPSVNNAEVAISGGLFLDHNTPSGSLGNVHWHFAYRGS